MKTTKEYGHEVQILTNGEWKTVGGCDRSSMTYSCICRAAKKYPLCEIRVLSYKEIVESIDRKKMGI